MRPIVGSAVDQGRRGAWGARSGFQAASRWQSSADGSRAAATEHAFDPWAEAWGYANDLWTLARVVDVIERRFNVRYHVSHVHRLLGQLGFSAQKPARLARERNDVAVEDFRSRRWKAIKKGSS